MSAPVKKFVSQLAVAVAGGLVAITLTGGGPAGAFNVPNNSVNSAKIVNNSVQGVDIRNSTVTGADIRNGAITALDVNRASLGRPRVQVYVDGGPNVGVLQGVKHAIGVGSVTNPQAGLFCIQPAPAINLSGVIPTIGIEYWGTALDDTIVGWSEPSTPTSCPSGAVTVASWSPSGTARNDVGFTVRID